MLREYQKRDMRERERGERGKVHPRFFLAQVARGAVTIHQSLVSGLSGYAEENSLSAIPRLVYLVRICAIDSGNCEAASPAA